MVATQLVCFSDLAAAGFDAGGGGAELGYVIGVFAHGRADDLSGFMTVWVRISRKPPFVLMRHSVGLHVLPGTTEQERSDQANERWEQIPQKTERGSREMASTLFGAAPRCLAYLDSTLRPSVPSLLSQQMTQMSPDRIGEALIALTGRDELLDEEVGVRRKHADQIAVLDGRVQDDQRDRLVEDVQMEELRRRGLARSALAKADGCWDAYLAQGFIEKSDLHQSKVDELQEIHGLLLEAEGELEGKRTEHKEFASGAGLADAVKKADEKRRNADGRRRTASGMIGRLTAKLDSLRSEQIELRAIAEGDDGKSVDHHVTAVAEAQDDLIAAKVESAAADKRLREAKKDLDRVEQGRQGLAGEALAALDGVVNAVSLLDAVTVDDQDRMVWEPRLWPHRDAVVVAPQDEARAVQALAAVPGATLVLADGPLHGLATQVLPDGLTSSVPLSSFLHALAARLMFRHEPPHVRDETLPEAIFGSFSEAFTGRTARLRLAQAEVRLAEAAIARQRGQEKQTDMRLRYERNLLEAAKAVARLADIGQSIEVVEASLAVEGKHESDADKDWNVADADYTDARSAFDNHEARLRRFQNEIKVLQEKKVRLVREERTASDAVDRIQIKLWQDTWNRSREAAVTLLEREAEQRGAHPATWWLTQSAVAMKEALTYTAADPDAPGTLAGPVADAADGLDDFEADLPNLAMFTSRTRRLRDLLDSTSETDEVLRDRIMRSRERRKRDIEETQTELNRLSEDLTKQQEMVESSIDTALKKVSTRLNQLDVERGYGAKLDVVISRPSGPDDSWGWHVTPRWRRSPSGGYISYREVANSAQVKIFAIQLVLAALLADDSVPARLLILDELGNSLGDANRKEVLSALHRVAQEQDITILGTCQDSVIYDAAGVCGEILWFCHASASEPYNRATRAWGFDADHRRVQLIAPWLQEGREET